MPRYFDRSESGVVVHLWSPSMELEAGELGVQGHPQQQSSLGPAWATGEQVSNKNKGPFGYISLYDFLNYNQFLAKEQLGLTWPLISVKD